VKPAVESELDASEPTVMLVVTGPGTYTGRRPRPVLKKAIPSARVKRTPFPSVFILETEGNAERIAEAVVEKCSDAIGHVTVVSAEVESELEAIKAAAVKIAAEHIESGQKFCFRLHKRGAHSLAADTFEIERQVGAAMWEALQQIHGVPPIVDLEEPDITVSAEVLGPRTAMGFSRKGWTACALGNRSAA